MYVSGREIRVSGGLLRIARLDAEKYESLDDPETLLEGLRKCSERIDIFTFMQIMPDTRPKFPYSMEWDNLAVIPVSTYENWWNNQIRSFPRNRARQAEKKGVTLREVPFSEDLVRGILEIYNETAVRQGRAFSHFGKDFRTVYREEATYLDRSIFIGAFLDDRLIGFVKMVTDQRNNQANLMNILSMIKHRDKAPTNALIAHSVKVCAERGVPNLVYQQFAYANKANDTIATFKEVNGFQRVDLPRYYVPISLLGKLALRLGFHHRFVDRIPGSVAIKLRQLRNAWHNRKLESVQ
jgi:hypothetical protein